MSFPELLEAVKALPWAEKVQLMHTLADEISPEEALLAKYFPPGAVYEVLSPVECGEAAAILQKMLDERKAQG